MEGIKGRGFVFVFFVEGVLGERKDWNSRREVNGLEGIKNILAVIIKVRRSRWGEFRSDESGDFLNLSGCQGGDRGGVSNNIGPLIVIP